MFRRTNNLSHNALVCLPYLLPTLYHLPHIPTRRDRVSWKADLFEANTPYFDPVAPTPALIKLNSDWGNFFFNQAITILAYRFLKPKPLRLALWTHLNPNNHFIAFCRSFIETLKTREIAIGNNGLVNIDSGGGVVPVPQEQSQAETPIPILLFFCKKRTFSTPVMIYIWFSLNGYLRNFMSSVNTVSWMPGNPS